jgi:hypothetical protein
MTKQEFTDSTYSLGKAIHHLNISKQYFEDVKFDTKGSIKEMFNNYIMKIDYILTNIRSKLSDESRKILTEETADSLIFDSIQDKLIHLDNKQRQMIEEIIESIIKGEEIIYEKI